MSKIKPYKESELTKERVDESIVAYTASKKGNLGIVIEKRDDIECGFFIQYVFIVLEYKGNINRKIIQYYPSKLCVPCNTFSPQ